jgi:hypothetical protein
LRLLMTHPDLRSFESMSIQIRALFVLASPPV